MTRTESIDVTVIGAGPAGCCAALRLLTLGYRVALVERRAFPRPHIGESLSPGTWNILDYIGATDTVREAGLLRGVAVRIAWETRLPEFVFRPPHRDSTIVDRSAFDARLLTLAKERGVRLFQPAQIRRISGEPGEWQVRVTGPEVDALLTTPLILDASGRAGKNGRNRVTTASTTVALWTQVAEGVVPAETRIEALQEGWLWGAPLRGGAYRAMAFLDPSSLKMYGGKERAFRALATNSILFTAVADAVLGSSLRSCSATPYIDTQFWNPGYIKVGENALALDPLSSCGVEKSMRLALQAVIAVNTLLRHPESVALVREFYESSVLESAVAHSVWSRQYYRQAWPHCSSAFWRDRSRPWFKSRAEEPAILARLREACTRHDQKAPESRTSSDRGMHGSVKQPKALSVSLQAQVRLSPDIGFVETPCVINDLVQLRPAVTHPTLYRPVAFLAGRELAPLLQITPMVHSLGQLISIWSSRMPVVSATQIAGWLSQRGLLETTTGG